MSHTTQKATFHEPKVPCVNKEVTSPKVLINIKFGLRGLFIRPRSP